MTRSNWIKAGAAASACAAVGAVAGIAGSAAAPERPRPPIFEKHRDEFRGPPIHSEAVVPKRGGGFETVTGDNGKLKSRSGNELTITEGTDTEKYKDVTVAIPSGATIIRNGRKASLDDLNEGDRVHVMQSPERTFVLAFDKSFRPPFGRHRRGGPGPGHPPPFGP